MILSLARVRRASGLCLFGSVELSAALMAKSEPLENLDVNETEEVETTEDDDGTKKIHKASPQ